MKVESLIVDLHKSIGTFLAKIAYRRNSARDGLAEAPRPAVVGLSRRLVVDWRLLCTPHCTDPVPDLESDLELENLPPFVRK